MSSKGLKKQFIWISLILSTLMAHSLFFFLSSQKHTESKNEIHLPKNVLFSYQNKHYTLNDLPLPIRKKYFHLMDRTEKKKMKLFTEFLRLNKNSPSTPLDKNFIEENYQKDKEVADLFQNPFPSFENYSKEFKIKYLSMREAYLFEDDFRNLLFNESFSGPNNNFYAKESFLDRKSPFITFWGNPNAKTKVTFFYNLGHAGSWDFLNLFLRDLQKFISDFDMAFHLSLYDIRSPEQIFWFQLTNCFLKYRATHFFEFLKLTQKEGLFLINHKQKDWRKTIQDKITQQFDLSKSFSICLENTQKTRENAIGTWSYHYQRGVNIAPSVFLNGKLIKNPKKNFLQSFESLYTQ